MSNKCFWLRCEKKPFEHRAALTPTTARNLIESGFKVYVERDHQRIFDDSEYEKYARADGPFVNRFNSGDQSRMRARREQLLAECLD